MAIKPLGYLIVMAVFSVTCSVSTANSLFDDPSDDPIPKLKKLGIDTSPIGLMVAFQDTSQSVEVRTESALALALSKDPEAERALLSALHDPNSDVRVGVMNALIFLGSPTAVPGIGEALTTDSNKTVRKLSIAALTVTGGDEAGEFLSRVASDVRESHSIRVAALQGLASELIVAPLDELELLVDDADPEIRARSAVVLSRGSAGYVDKLVQSVNDSRVPDWVWRDVVWELERKSGRNFETAGDKGRLTKENRLAIQNSVNGWWSGESEL